MFRHSKSAMSMTSVCFFFFFFEEKMCNIINIRKGLQQGLSLQQTAVIQHTAFSLYPNETENLRKVEKHLSIHSYIFTFCILGKLMGSPVGVPFHMSKWAAQEVQFRVLYSLDQVARFTTTEVLRNGLNDRGSIRFKDCLLNTHFLYVSA